ncbi:putative pentatricopeptide repeat-containing protein At3g18840 [Apium graveolens]|uniref:putative pentatricopeptide repeat-containing protein At3g18840 n=1 Tax=Apium graveolens TaxID=4045 RepID=UPI003D79328E
MLKGSLIEGLVSHGRAIKTGLTSTVFICNQLIHLYSKHGLIQDSHKLFDEMPQRNVFSWNAIISACIKAQNFSQAQVLFRTAPVKDSVTYNTMFSGYVNFDGYEGQAFNLFLEMQLDRDENAVVDEFTLTAMLNLTAKLCTVSYGTQLHCRMLKTGNNFSGFATSALIDMYSKCECFQEARRVFDGCFGAVDLVTKNAMVAACCREGELGMARDLFWTQLDLVDTVSWNTLISGYTQNGHEKEAIELFRCMAEEGFRWNDHTVVGVLSACSGLKSLKLGKEIHAWVLKEKMNFNPFVSSGIVDVYCKCGNMKCAESVYSSTGLENAFSITSMIVGYSLRGNMVDARRLFDSLTERNSVVWTSMFSGYFKSQQCDMVFELFNEFKVKEATLLDPPILISMLGSCAVKAIVDPGKQIHAYLYRLGMEMDVKMLSAIIDMYSKCGNITYAQNIFQNISASDTVLYNVMISGYAHHGFEHQALRHFEEMKERRLIPDAGTFIAILSACRHCGIAELGELYFTSMTKDYDILPETDHYACLIDLYGRANKLEKAVALMREMPLEPDAVILGTFLNACKMNRNLELARETEEKLLKIEKGNGARYVQLANIYASEGKWDEMGRIRKKMRGNEVKKFAGCSWAHVGKKVHIFTSGDKLHSETEAIYGVLDSLNPKLVDRELH